MSKWQAARKRPRVHGYCYASTLVTTPILIYRPLDGGRRVQTSFEAATDTSTYAAIANYPVNYFPATAPRQGADITFLNNAANGIRQIFSLGADRPLYMDNQQSLPAADFTQLFSIMVEGV